MGKSDDSSAQIPLQPQTNNNDMMMSMFEMMMGMMNNQQQAMPEAPVIEEAPEIKKVEPVDWTKAHEDLQQKMAADYSNEQDKKVGLEDTTYTSPLLDEETTTSNNVILGA